MSLSSTAPLLRGIGTTIILIGAVIGFWVTRHDVHKDHIPKQGANVGSVSQAKITLPAAGPKSDTTENSESSPQSDSLVEEVAENLTFEWMALVGAAVVSSSFYVEWAARRKKSA
jgi:hypothetical protein